MGQTSEPLGPWNDISVHNILVVCNILLVCNILVVCNILLVCNILVVDKFLEPRGYPQCRFSDIHAA